MTRIIKVRHTFEAAHRQPQMAGKCINLHGHSWAVEVAVTAPGEPTAVIDFGVFKKGLRRFVDDYLDHGAMLGEEDPLVPTLLGMGSKVYVFSHEDGYWPSVENVAALIGRQMHTELHEMVRSAGARIHSVTVSETPTNSAVWVAPRDEDA